MRRRLTEWEVKGFWPGEPIWTKSVESTVERKGVTPWLPASVPGGVHRALQRAGLIPDPGVGMNSLLCEWVENRWWVWRTVFNGPEQDRVKLCFEGIDDNCLIYLNGECIARHSGIYEPVVCDVTRSVRRGEENTLLVVLTGAPEEQGQIGRTSLTRTQKARFGYKWDFCTRLVNLGLWQPVWLETVRETELCDPWVSSDVRDGAGIVRVRAHVKGKARSARVRVSYEGRTAAERVLDFGEAWDPVVDAELTIEMPACWYPNGMGGQPLYTVEVEAEGAEPWQTRTGIRSLGYVRCTGAGADALPYCPVINGKTVYIRGVNLTPLDLCYGDVTEDDYRALFVRLRHMGVNTVRVWGGGIIETETFYRLADENGILVWQEFIQSSSGIDNVPCHDPAFMDLLERNSRAAVLGRRGHVCLTWWSGGNELADAAFRPITDGDENIAMLKRLTAELDPGRLFLPSSPSGPSFGLDSAQAGHHDVHGNWQYDGIRAHYAKYNRSDSMLQSEFGADGLSSPQQLKRILPEEDYGVYTMQEHPVIRHHGEWWETLRYRDRPLFGEPENVEQWVSVSQMMQAEAIRYIVLSNRRRRGQNGGSIIWQMNEPWPNTSCTSLLEYDGAVKAAYYAVRRAYAPSCAGLIYDSLIVPAGENKSMTAFADDLTGRGSVMLTFEALSLTGKKLFSRTESCRLSGGKAEMTFSFCVPEQAEHAWIGRVRADYGDRACEECYCFAQKEETPLRSFITVPQTEIHLTREEDRITLQNRGQWAAVWLMLRSRTDNSALFSDNGIVLMPGESRTLLTDAPAVYGTDLAGRVLC